MVVTELPSRQILGFNQRAYQRLKLSLTLNLRHQILLAVCDDLMLRTRLIARLWEDFATEPAELWHSPVKAATAAAAPSSQRFINLELDLQVPDLSAQLQTAWQRSQSQNVSAHQLHPGAPHPDPQHWCWQIVGIEKLTRQPGGQQRQFLNSLRSVESLIHQLDCSLLIWLPWPWFRLMQQASPEFWQSRTGVFEFAGDPTPVEIASLPREPWLPDIVSSASTAMQPPFPSPSAVIPTPPPQAITSARPATPETSETSATPEQLTLIWHDAPRQTPQEVSLLQRLERLIQQQADATALAHAYWVLGQHYRDRLETAPQDAALITMAIRTYEAAAQNLPPSALKQGDLLNDLGSLYWLQAQQIDSPTQALGLLKQALKTYQQGTQWGSDPDILSRLHSNSAAVYSVLAHHEQPTVNLQQAIAAYHKALQHIQADDTPLEYASLQNSLGAIYWRMAHHGPARPHLDHAITAYIEARRYCQPHQDAACYAMIQNNLGIGYWSLAQFEQPSLMLKQAIAAYHSALAYRTLAANPAGCAATHNNLGTAYWELAQQHPEASPHRQKLWQRSITAYQAALNAIQRLHTQQGGAFDLSFDPKTTHHNLAILYRHLAEAQQHLGHDPTQTHLSRALHHILATIAASNSAMTHAMGTLGAPSLAADSVMGTLAHIVRTHHQLLGLAGQQAALAQVPSTLLPELLSRL